MSSKEEIVKIIAEEKKKLEDEIRRLEEELARKKVLAEALGKLLGEISFVPARELVEERPSREVHEELRGKKGDKLADLYIGENSIRIVPVVGKFDEGIPPLRSFLVKRVFEEMRRRDLERGKSEDEAFSYTIINDEEGMVKEIVLRNVDVSDEKTMRNIRNSVKWTLERILERIRAEYGE